MSEIDEIELSIQSGDRAIFDQSSIRHYLKAIAKTQVLILKEMRKEADILFDIRKKED
ncbi:hypothetical protein KAU33_04240 [Candidatus Dependentiae bacterium]|nr:hypothetical protein [Candidatus Dependentiae bacterium]